MMTINKKKGLKLRKLRQFHVHIKGCCINDLKNKNIGF